MKMVSNFFVVLIVSMFLVTSSPLVSASVMETEPVVEEVISTPVHETLKVCKDKDGVSKSCEDKDLMEHLLVSMGGLKGASALAIAFVISKLLLLLILSPIFSNIFPLLLKGSVKLTVAMGLNIVVGILALMTPPTSLSFTAAIMHSSVLALFSVFANQAFKQYLTEKGKA